MNLKIILSALPRSRKEEGREPFRHKGSELLHMA